MITTDPAADVLARRKARFRAEARKAPPPLPTNRLTVWSGKVTRSDKDAALAAFVARKARLGQPLNEAQQRAASALSAGIALSAGSANARAAGPPRQVLPSKTVARTAAAAKSAAAAEAASKHARKLEKKLRDIESLEQKVADGAVLEANQLAKIESKALVAAELAALRV